MMYFVDVIEHDPVHGAFPVSIELVDGAPNLLVEILAPGPQGIPGPAVTKDPVTGANFAVLANGGTYIYTQPTQPVMDEGDIWIPTPL